MKEKEIEIYLRQLEDMGMDKLSLNMYMSRIAQMRGADQNSSVKFPEVNLKELFSEKIKLKTDALLTEEQQRGIACCADIAFYNDDFLNALETGKGKEKALQLLNIQWEITNKSGLLKTLEWLKSCGHRKDFIKVAVALNLSSEAAVLEYFGREFAANAASGCGQDACKTAFARQRNMRAAVKAFETDGFFKGGILPDFLAWDLCRYISLCRGGFEAGLIKESETMKKIVECLVALQNTYKSWEDLSIAYCFGHYVSVGHESYADLRKGREILLSDTNSPFVKLAFRAKDKGIND